jgi:two-component system sensor histidine kinase KdpD
MTDPRKNPDALLARVQREEEQATRGRLKIFFGASAGVGKTYAMLSAAHQQRARGVDVVVGVVETHGRSETAALLEGLEVLPRREVEYRGTRLAEFDLDGALARRPALILVDELAHNNAPGTRHPKRWQDVEELLGAGIDVYTTVNVQHLESLNDVVGGITGIRVGETIADRIFDRADEITLVDLPPDELLERLRQGKVYLPGQAEQAIRNFFRKGNLIALRELALRRTADRVDDQMRAYRVDEAIRAVWQTRGSLLVCIGPRPGSEKLVRNAARLARELEVDWHAIYVETPVLQRLPEARRDRILRVLKLAQDLGAQTATIPGQSPAQEIVAYARSHNLARIVIGRGPKRRWPFVRSTAEKVGALSADLDVVHIGLGAKPESGEALVPGEPDASTQRASIANYAWAVAACAIATAATWPLVDIIALANIVMIFLLAVVLVAVKLGRGPAVVAAFLSVASFDFFYVPPRFTFAVSDVQYIIVFAVMLAVALIIGHLTSGLRYQARVASHRETRSRALYEMARELSGVLMEEQVVAISDRHIEASFRMKAVILLPDGSDRLRQPEGDTTRPDIDLAIAQWVFDHGKPAGFGTDTLPGSRVHYVPLQAPMRTRGVLALEPSRSRMLLIPEQRRLLDTFAALIGIALERVHYVQVAQDALVKIESERLRNSILSALSHDLRTPLTALVGLAESLTLTPPALTGTQRELANAIRDESLRMNALVNNLLDMARLQAGDVKLNRQWHSLEEVVGSSVKLCESLLAAHRLRIDLPPDLPLVELDAVLFERVLCNLLENAAKYTPAGSEVRIEAEVDEKDVRLSVADNGPGLAPGSEEAIFEQFRRGERESATPGVGLGLTISRAIVEAHRGKIWAERDRSGGARFVVSLPRGTPPAMHGELPVASAAGSVS